MSNDQLHNVLRRLKSIRFLTAGGRKSPHKIILLLAITKLYERNPYRENSFPLSDELESLFVDTWLAHYPETDRKKIFIEYPYYHLASDDLLTHKIIPGKEDAFREYQKSRLTKRRLRETVETAFITHDLHVCLRDKNQRDEIISILHSLIEKGSKSHDDISQVSGSSSLFSHEQAAIDEIIDRIKKHSLGLVLTNLEIHDPQSNRYFETDLIVVSTFGIYVVELKHWSGRIEIRANSWIQNRSFYKPDPHKANNFKAKLLKGIYERKFPQFPSIYFESVVILTNPDITVDGASIPSTQKHNPTFASIEKFIQYLKHQRKYQGKRITLSQCKSFLRLLEKLHTPSPPRDFVFPGYEIVERLYQHTDRAEVVARRTDIRHRRLSRLRIFFPPTSATQQEKKIFHERATATLNAVALVGDHPNIIKVWSVPNENNYIVEGSDWSEQGTLRDIMATQGPLSLERTLNITRGILSGLGAIQAQCVVHRELAPENILMVGDIPKLMNFDMSFQLEDDRPTVIDDTAQLKRSPYIAPEIYKGGSIPEATADLFSVGVLLYEMLTGERPFACSTDLDRTGGVLDPARVAKLDGDDIPPKVKQLILELLQPDPENRPASASQVAERLPSAQQVKSPVSFGDKELEPGTCSGIYGIKRFVKKGAEAQIYEGLGPRGKPVAIKLFNGDVPLERVQNEQELAGTIRHPSILRVDNYNRWEEDGRFYISFDWISGGVLKDEINRGNRPSPEHFRKIATQLIAAISELHSFCENGERLPILHNDIKPENILLTDDNNRPVLIDFGLASRPHVGLYAGTEGYVAPDLRLGQERQYCEDGDLYALGVTLHEWLFGVRPGAGHALRPDLPSGLCEWLAKATSPNAEERFPSAKAMLAGLETAFQIAQAPDVKPSDKPLKGDGEGEQEKALHLARIVAEQETSRHPNPFLTYLNSLHCRSAASENALAESQATNPLFSRIHVSHPLADTILDILRSQDSCHVILTGHAGDGKSTIALDVYKRLKGLPLSKPIDIDWKRKEDLETDTTSVSLIKDFSECSDLWPDLIEEMKVSKRRFLLVSNTGALIDAFTRDAERAGGDRIKLESDLLETLESSVPRKWSYGGAVFTVINLSMMDNLGIAEEIFKRMVAEDNWKACQENGCRNECPVRRNVELIRQNLDTVTSRLFLAYRRMYEYGTRLTLRQICAHLAYMITSGLSHQDIDRMTRKAAQPLMSDFMFFNRFFGDNGREEDEAARQVRAVREVREQHFGSRTAPTWERKLWLRSHGISFHLQAEGCGDEFVKLRRYGVRLAHDEEISDAQARRQVRRMMFFLHRFDETDDGAFLKTFLNSPMIVNFARWQKDAESHLSLSESAQLQHRVLHVLQEHFTGVRLPEGTPNDRYIFITLSRHAQNIRQSAQVVLARIPEDDLVLESRVFDNGCSGKRRELILGCRGRRSDAELHLGLPFLDYVMLRNRGEVGEDLQVSYVDRLERFKGQLLQEYRERQQESIMLVRLRTGHTFRRQIFAVRGDRLEVTDG